MTAPDARSGIRQAGAIALAVLALALLTWGHVALVGRHGPLFDAALDFLHLPGFAVAGGVAALVVQALLPRAAAPFCALLAVAVCALSGAALELLQAGTTRTASLGDLGNDLLGAAAGVAVATSVMLRTPGGVRTTLRALSLASLVSVLAFGALPLSRQLEARRARAAWHPVLFEPGVPLSRCFLFADGVRMDFVPAGLPEGAGTAMQTALRVSFASGKFSALGVHGFHPDWSGYADLCFPYWLEGGRELPAKLVVEDDRGRGGRSGRQDTRLLLQPGPGRVCVPIDPNGALYAGRIARVRLAATQAGTLLIGGFRLEKEARTASEAQRAGR